MTAIDIATGTLEVGSPGWYRQMVQERELYTVYEYGVYFKLDKRLLDWREWQYDRRQLRNENDWSRGGSGDSKLNTSL
jgi:ribosome maturation factor RimP